MMLNGVQIRDAAPPEDIDPQSSLHSTEFLDGQHFGSMYLPHGGLLAAISNRLHNLFGKVPEMGRHHKPLSRRDMLMVLGEKACVISFSEGMHKHLPLWHSTKWSEFMTVPEEAVIASKVLPAIVDLRGLNEHLEEKWNFVNPISFLIPAIFYGARGTDAGRAAAITIDVLATELFEREKGRVLADAPNRSAPLEIKESLRRFKIDHPEPRRTAFIMMQFGASRAHDDITAAIRSALGAHGIAGLRADDKQYHDDLLPNVLTYVYGCHFGIAVFERIEVETFNPNVALEIGYLLALPKPVCLLKDRTLKTLQADLIGKLYKEFDPHEPSTTIPPVLTKWMQDREII